MTTTSTDLTTLGRWPDSSRRMSFGLTVQVGEKRLPDGRDPRFEDYVTLAKAGAAAGFEFVWMADHYTLPDDDGGQYATWEGMTMLAGLAGATRDLGLNFGPLVVCNSFRNPGGLVKIAEAIDEISGGGFVLGIGAGWNQPEYDAFGFPFDYRVSRFEEAIQIMSGLLHQGEVSLDGRFYQFKNAVNRPRGPRGAEGGPPLMVGSRGERMLRILARYADAWNGGSQTDRTIITDSLAKLDAACEDVGRDPQTMVRTMGVTLVFDDSMTPDNGRIIGDEAAMLDHFRFVRDHGVRHLTVSPRPLNEEGIARVGELINRFDAE